MKNVLAGLAVVASISQYLCIFCCVVPAIAGLAGLFAAFGMAGQDTFILGDIARVVHPWRTEIMVTSVVLISISWSLWFYNRRLAAQKIECGCAKSANKMPVFLMIASFILVFNMVGYVWTH